MGARPAFERYRDVDVTSASGRRFHLRRTTYRDTGAPTRPFEDLLSRDTSWTNCIECVARKTRLRWAFNSSPTLQERTARHRRGRVVVALHSSSDSDGARCAFERQRAAASRQRSPGDTRQGSAAGLRLHAWNTHQRHEIERACVARAPIWRRIEMRGCCHDGAWMPLVGIRSRTGDLHASP